MLMDDTIILLPALFYAVLSLLLIPIAFCGDVFSVVDKMYGCNFFALLAFALCYTAI